MSRQAAVTSAATTPFSSSPLQPPLGICGALWPHPPAVVAPPCRHQGALTSGRLLLLLPLDIAAPRAHHRSEAAWQGHQHVYASSESC